MKILILEDSQERMKQFRERLVGHEVVIVEESRDCIVQLQNSTWDVLFLDHDLGGQTMVESGPGTGYEVARWLEANPQRQPPHIVVHSFNPDGADKMIACLPQAMRAPGIWASDKLSEL